MKKILLLSIAVLTIMSCRKKEIDVQPEEGTPEFSISFLASRTMEDWTAGYDNYFMHTDWMKDDKDVVTFIGKMAPKDCDGDCNGSIQFELRDFLPQSFEKVDFVDKFYNGTYKIGKRASTPSAVEEAYLVSFNGHNNFKEDETFWEFGDNLTAFNDSIIQHIYFPSQENKVTVFYRNSDKQKDNHTYHSSTLNFTDQSICTGDFKINQIKDNKIEISIDATVKSTATVWGQTLVDGTIVQGFTYENQPWTISIDEKSTIVAFSDLSDGCVLERQIVVSYDKEKNSLSILKDNSDIQMKKIKLGSDLGLSTFAIQYIDADGKVYRSDLGVQHKKRYFKITSREPYLENDAGQKTVKLGVEFVIDVFLPNGEFITLQDGKGVIAVGEP